MIVIYCSTSGLRYFLGIGSTTKSFESLGFCADKGTQTDCGGSADLPAVIDCVSCDATTNIGRVLVAQASLALTLTPYSIPMVFRSINSLWSALALLTAVRVPRSATLIVK